MDNYNAVLSRPVFGEKEVSPCNINVYEALKTHNITKNGKIFFPFVCDKYMNLDANITSFENGKKITEALCNGLSLEF